MKKRIMSLIELRIKELTDLKGKRLRLGTFYREELKVEEARLCENEVAVLSIRITALEEILDDINTSIN